MTDRSPGLLQRMGGREGLDLHARVDDARERRVRLQVDLEEAPARRLAREANVADGRLLAPAEAVARRRLRQMAVGRVECLADPVADPFQPRRLVELELVLEISADARHQ